MQCILNSTEFSNAPSSSSCSFRASLLPCRSAQIPSATQSCSFAAEQAGGARRRPAACSDAENAGSSYAGAGSLAWAADPNDALAELRGGTPSSCPACGLPRARAGLQELIL